MATCRLWQLHWLSSCFSWIDGGLLLWCTCSRFRANHIPHRTPAVNCCCMACHTGLGVGGSFDADRVSIDIDLFASGNCQPATPCKLSHRYSPAKVARPSPAKWKNPAHRCKCRLMHQLLATLLPRACNLPPQSYDAFPISRTWREYALVLLLAFATNRQLHRPCRY